VETGTTITADVSVCIVNWNCRELLRSCLESLRRSAHELVLEIVVVDNGSADGSADMIVENFPEVVLLRNPDNLGFARANNQAAELACGRYLFFLNNDTLVPPGALRRLVEYADAHPEAGLVGPRLRDGRGDVQISCRLLPTVATFISRLHFVRMTGLMRSHYRRYRRRGFDPSATRPVELLMGAALLVRRRVLSECGGWDERFVFGGEDLELCWRIGRRYRVVYHGEVEVIHYGRESTRQHVSYAGAHIAVGFARYLRKTRARRAALLLYKVAVTADAPIQLIEKWLQGMSRLIRGRRDDAGKSFLFARTMWHFLSKGLIPFWRA
jgi:GT2 family glycosyltransferase